MKIIWQFTSICICSFEKMQTNAIISGKTSACWCIAGALTEMTYITLTCTPIVNEVGRFTYKVKGHLSEVLPGQTEMTFNLFT